MTAIADEVGSLADYLDAHGTAAPKLHLGCGGQRWRDFINVDLHPHDESVTDTSRSGCVADVFADMRRLGLEDESVAEIFTSHTLEHFTRWEAVDMLADWHRMLRRGGRVVIETPDFRRCVLWLFHPRRSKRRLARNMFYGNQWNRIDYETHRYVWSNREIRTVLGRIGFSHVVVTHQTETHSPGRDMRIEARK